LRKTTDAVVLLHSQQYHRPERTKISSQCRYA